MSESLLYAYRTDGILFSEFLLRTSTATVFICIHRENRCMTFGTADITGRIEKQ